MKHFLRTSSTPKASELRLAPLATACYAVLCIAHIRPPLLPALAVCITIFSSCRSWDCLYPPFLLYMYAQPVVIARYHSIQNQSTSQNNHTFRALFVMGYGKSLLRSVHSIRQFALSRGMQSTYPESFQCWSTVALWAASVAQSSLPSTMRYCTTRFSNISEPG